MTPNGAPRANKKSPRKKTGCLTCRSRHMRCDEAQPKCSNCVKAGLWCERSSMIVFAPESQSKTLSKAVSPQVPAADNRSRPSNASQETAYLLRQYQDDIGVWMDLFDHGCNFQRLLLTRVHESPLLKHCVCALSARQQSLLSSDADRLKDWNLVAEHHYGGSLALLRDALDASTQDPDIYSLPACILLLSYELMSDLGDDYTRHFYGAKSLIESYSLSRISSDPLLISSYWIFIRHDVDVALTKETPPTLEEEFCYESLLPESDESDILGNKMLLLTAKVLRYIFCRHNDNLEATATFTAALSKDLNAWPKQAQRVSCALDLDDGSKWYPTPAAASGMQMYHASKLLLLVHCSSQDNVKIEAEIQQCAELILAISRSGVSDAVQVQAVHPLFHAARCVRSPKLRQDVTDILIELQRRTGFHTQSKVDALKLMM